MQAQVFTRARMSPASAQAFAARNLDLLAAIEHTLDALTGDTRILQGINETYREVQDQLSGEVGPIDPSSRICSALDKASEACVRIYRDAQNRHRSACTDPLLKPDDGVADAYTEFMNSVHDLHDTIESLKEWIATHDAVLEPTTGQVFQSTDDLFESLLSGK